MDDTTARFAQAEETQWRNSKSVLMIDLSVNRLNTNRPLGVRRRGKEPGNEPAEEPPDTEPGTGTL